MPVAGKELVSPASVTHLISEGNCILPEVIAPPEKHMFSAYNTWLLKPQHHLVKQLKKMHEPSVHGHKTWDSSYLLMDYFEHHPLKRRSRVLEIGCGWGPASIYCAKRWGARVTGADLDPAVFAYLKVQSALNDVTIDTLEKPMSDIRGKALEKYDIIIGADICFWDELADDWRKLIQRAAKAGTKRVLVADPGRSPFLALTDRCEKHFSSEMHHWYAVEPKRFEGFILDVDL